jgi:hypothetical protein
MTPETPNFPPVFFNHLYIVLDDKTYRAIQASDFLRSAFPGYETRSTLTAAGETWSGTYYYCQDNYLEFFGESTGKHWRTFAKGGWAGLAFSTDRPGGAEAVRKVVMDTFGYQPFNELRKLNLGGKMVNWFYHTRLAEQLGMDSFDSWVMEYHPDIFGLKGIPLPVSGELTRRAYLSPWNQENSTSVRREKRRSAPVFSRVLGATINMDGPRCELYSQILQALGYSLKEESGQVLLQAHGFSLTIRIQSEDATPPGYRLSSLLLEMVRPSVAPITFVFAPGSRLTLNEDLTAEWQFSG